MTPDEIKADIRGKLYALCSEVSDGWIYEYFDHDMLTPTIEYIYHTYVVKDQPVFEGQLW